MTDGKLTKMTTEEVAALPPGPYVVGLDQSLTSFGFAAAGGPFVPLAEVWRIVPNRLRGHERLEMLLDQVSEAVMDADVVVMEGLSFGAKGSALLDLAGLSWMIRQELWKAGKPYAIVDPATRAKYITGKGNAPKDECLIEVVKRFPDVRVTGNDEADALTLAAMGRDYYGYPLVKMPADRTALLRATRTDKNRKGQPKIDWPVIDSQGETHASTAS